MSMITLFELSIMSFVCCVQISSPSSEKVPNVEAQTTEMKNQKNILVIFFFFFLEKLNLAKWMLTPGVHLVVIMKLHYPADRRRFQHWVENKSFNHLFYSPTLFVLILSLLFVWVEYGTWCAQFLGTYIGWCGIFRTGCVLNPSVF